MRIAVLASGRGSNLQAFIDAIEKGLIQAEIVAVVSDKPGSQALERARRHGIETAVFEEREYPDRQEYDAALIHYLQEKEVELICLAGFMRILSSTFVRTFANRIINVHPSLLPAFPGLNAQKQALDYGVKFSGCTVHFVDEGMDTGPIISQRVVPVLDGDSVESLSERILEQEHELYPLVLQWLVSGNVQVNGRKVSIVEGGNSGAEQKKSSGKCF